MQVGDTIKQTGTHRGRKPADTPGGPPIDRDARWRIIESFEHGRHSYEIRGENIYYSGAADGSETLAKSACDRMLIEIFGEPVSR